jgi:dolichyl-phosphate beta-glucosyltransferase
MVIPAFRESERLPRYLRALTKALAETNFACDVLVVDDGSGPEEVASLRRLFAEVSPAYPGLIPPLFLETNRGKGAAVRAGFDRGKSYDWLGFVDADGSIPPAEVCRLLDMAATSANQEKALFASRVKMLGRRVERSALRHLSGRLFAFLVGLNIAPNIYDSQCGFKLMPSNAYFRIAPWLEENGFCFDVELLAALLALNVTVEEAPIDWIDCPGSKVSLLRDSWRMLQGIQRIQHRSTAWTS